MGAKGREYAGTQEALDAANTMATLYENGSDEKDPELFDTKMAEAEAKIRGVFDAIYEKKESSRSREQVGQSSEGENTNLDERVDARLENQDFTLLVKNYSAQFQEYGGWLKEMGGRVDPAEFSGVMDGIQKMLGGDLSRIVKPGKLDAFTLGELKSSLQEIKRSLGPLRQGTTSEVARLAFEDVSKFIENLP
jgi:hypothetical protein